MNILILSPHTDDAELGCWGSIVKFIENGNNIYWVVFSTAAGSLPENLPKGTLKEKFLNIAKLVNLDMENINIFNYKVRYLHLHRQNLLEHLIRIRKQFNPQRWSGFEPFCMALDILSNIGFENTKVLFNLISKT